MRRARKVRVVRPPELRLRSASIRDAVALRAELIRILDAPGTVRIDASAVESVDTTILQLLAAFVHDLTAASRAVEWSGRSVTLEDAAKSLGLCAAIGLPATAT